MTRRVGAVRRSPDSVTVAASDGVATVDAREETDRLLAQAAAAARAAGRPYITPPPGALDTSAWYLASVLCAEVGHNVPVPPWPYEHPCRACLARATEQVHAVLATLISHIAEVQHGRNEGADPKEKKQGKCAGKRSPVARRAGPDRRTRGGGGPR